MNWLFDADSLASISQMALLGYLAIVIWSKVCSYIVGWVYGIPRDDVMYLWIYSQENNYCMVAVTAGFLIPATMMVVVMFDIMYRFFISQ